MPAMSPSRRDSTPFINRTVIDSVAARAKIEALLKKPENDEKSKRAPVNGPVHPLSKYIASHSRTLMHTPLAICTKAASILADSTYVDLAPVAWELLLEKDQELAASSGEYLSNIISILALFSYILHHLLTF